MVMTDSFLHTSYLFKNDVAVAVIDSMTVVSIETSYYFSETNMQVCQVSCISHVAHVNMPFLMLTHKVIKLSRK